MIINLSEVPISKFIGAINQINPLPRSQGPPWEREIRREKDLLLMYWITRIDCFAAAILNKQENLFC